jgi:hypothetical protein
MGHRDLCILILHNAYQPMQFGRICTIGCVGSHLKMEGSPQSRSEFG